MGETAARSGRGPAARAAPSGAVLVVNAGSSSLKTALIASDDSLQWREQWTWQANAAEGEPDAPEAVLQAGIPALLERCSADLALIGHRVVHGGSRFTTATRLNHRVLAELESLVALAPLHNAPALRVMRWLAQRLGTTPQWACFDTGFHRTLPPHAFSYALPAAWRELGLRRYGFHGLNHQHVSEVVQRLEGSDSAGSLRLISCHLGAGCSLCAIRGGISIATTMGYTPLEGLVMASRSGSVDPGILLDLLRRGVSPVELERQLQNGSGLLGLSGLSGNMRELRQAAASGHPGAQLAIAVFRERLWQGIGAMAASLGGVDVIALSGGIGENDRELQRELQDDLRWLGPFRLHVVSADEEGVIARACRDAADRAGRGDEVAAGLQPQARGGNTEKASTAPQTSGLANQ